MNPQETPEELKETIPGMETEATHAAAEKPSEATENEATNTEDNPLEKLQRELEESRDKYIRLMAEFDNFRKRSAREKLEFMQTAGKDVIKDLLPVLDDMERAAKSAATATDVEAVKEGIMLIKDKLSKNLAQKGLKPMESIGQAFDADFHEAVTEIPAPVEEMKGKIIDEVEKGYLLNEKIIRYAKVVVGK